MTILSLFVTVKICVHFTSTRVWISSLRSTLTFKHAVSHRLLLSWKLIKEQLIKEKSEYVFYKTYFLLFIFIERSCSYIVFLNKSYEHTTVFFFNKNWKNWKFLNFFHFFLFNPFTYHPFLMKFAFYGLFPTSVDIRPLPGAWVVELLGVVLGVQDHKKNQIFTARYSSMAAKELSISVRDR